MKYAPGSFSKNFGWHGTGLRKLHSAIRAGFGDQLLSVGRQDWRDRSGIADKNIDLLPINFFLHKPHNGPDRVKNMLVLCPHHHLQFDRGVLRLKQTANGFVIQSRVKGDALHGKQIALKHDLDPDMVTYHWDWHSRTWR